MEPDTPAGVETAETLCHFLRTALFLIKHRVSSKSKLLLHLLKTTRVKNLKKALSDAVPVSVPSPAACLSPDDIAASYISPRPLRHYEFSCSNTPASTNFLMIRRRRKRSRVALAPPTRRYVTESNASPLVSGTETEEGCHVVDMEAARFIEMFYRELRLQKLMAGREAPDPYPYG